jgi:hypothetical protein
MRILTDIDKDGDRTTQNERVRSRRARLGWQDNFVAALDVQQQRGEVQRRRACMSEQSLAAARSNRALALVISEAIFIRNPAVLRPEAWRHGGFPGAAAQDCISSRRSMPPSGASARIAMQLCAIPTG